MSNLIPPSEREDDFDQARDTAEEDALLKLSHYSDEPFNLLYDRQYDQEADGPYGKPRGFWVSVDGEHDWEWWCREESFHLSGLEHRMQLRLVPGHDVLILSNAHELIAFHEEYSEPYYGDLSKIAWGKVAQRYSGIIITPYLWEMRYDGNASWYYGWDCASGCIWDLAALEVV